MRTISSVLRRNTLYCITYTWHSAIAKQHIARIWQSKGIGALQMLHEDIFSTWCFPNFQVTALACRLIRNVSGWTCLNVIQERWTRIFCCAFFFPWWFHGQVSSAIPGARLYREASYSTRMNFHCFCVWMLVFTSFSHDNFRKLWPIVFHLGFWWVLIQTSSSLCKATFNGSLWMIVYKISHFHQCCHLDDHSKGYKRRWFRKWYLQGDIAMCRGSSGGFWCKWGDFSKYFYAFWLSHVDVEWHSRF